MDVHQNAWLTPRSRAELVRRMLVEGQASKVVAAAFGVTVKAVNKRVGRFQTEGPTGLSIAPCDSSTGGGGTRRGGTRAAEEQPHRFLFTIGPICGHNFGETDDGGENDLVGGEITYSSLPGLLGGVSLKQAILYSFNGDDDGVNGRSIVSLDFAPDLGVVRPFLTANFGGVYGPSVQDGLVAGPGSGFNVDLFEGVAMPRQGSLRPSVPKRRPPRRGYFLGRAGLRRRVPELEFAGWDRAVELRAALIEAAGPPGRVGIHGEPPGPARR